MGCNYYHKPSDRHIGKSSRGWCFALHVYPEEGIHNLEDWIPILAEGTILNEYHEEISLDGLISCIANREIEDQSFSQSFLDQNLAEVGPNNLLRPKVGTDSQCMGHGPGTWDYITGDFS